MRKHLSLLLCLLVAAVAANLSCLDEDGEPVDYFMAIKHNKVTDYSYMDSNHKNFTYSPHTLGAERAGSVAKTIMQTFGSAAEGINHIKWNDQTPDGKQHSSYGHTKGIIAWDGSAGFWLTHSVPKFPEVEDAYDFPVRETKYGQSFLCINLDHNNLNTVAQGLLLNKPALYVQDIKDTFSMNFMDDLLAKKFQTATPALQTMALETVGGNKFTQFAKNAKWGKDIFEFGMATHYSQDFMAETWMNGVRPQPTFCKSPEYPQAVHNIRYMNITGVVIKETQDHSKWGVTVDAPHVSCVGGINRQQSQAGRAGGFTCFEDQAIANAFREVISVVDPCPASAY